MSDSVPERLRARMSSLREQRLTQYAWWISVGFVLGLVLGAAVYVWLDARRHAEDLAELQDYGRPASEGLESAFERIEAFLATAAAFMRASGPGMSPREFGLFAETLMEPDDDVRSLLWIPVVEGQKREAFEAEASALYGRPIRLTGRLTGRLKERSTEPKDGTSSAPSAQDTYYPVLFMAPLVEEDIGWNAGFDPTRKSFFRQAAAGDGIYVSARFEMVRGQSGASAIAILQPVRFPGAEVTSGFIVLTVRLEAVARRWFGQVADEGVHVQVVDKTGDVAEPELFEGGPEVDPKTAVRRTFEVQLGNRTWQALYEAPPGFGGSAGEAGVGGAVVVAMAWLVTLGMVAVDRIRRLRQDVQRAMQLGQYEVEKKLGEGAMGMVLLARHGMMKRPTALKLMLRQNESSIARFEKEVMLSARLNHPNIVSVYDYGRTDDGIFYYAMEYLPGIDLQKLVDEEGPMPDGRAVFLLRQLARGLLEAHTAGLVHRDVKPANMILTQVGTRSDLLKILDFGLAKPVADLDPAERGKVSGTPLYMAPEAVATPDDVGPPADVYAFGCVAYFLVAGRPPITGPTVRDILKRQMDQEPRSISEQAKVSVTTAFANLVMRCLEKKAELRPSTEELVHLLDEMPVHTAWTEWSAAAWWVERGQALQQQAPSLQAPSFDTVTVQRRRV